MSPKSLFDIIEGKDPNRSMYSDHVNPSKLRVPLAALPLEIRFKLARDICLCIHYLHLCNIVHKSLRSENILFFCSTTKQDMLVFSKPYIIGFEHSRLDTVGEVTVTRTIQNVEHDGYRYPGYRSEQSMRSTKLHDLYSLGLVLLEIATWKNLDVLFDSRRVNKIAEVLNSRDVTASPVTDLKKLVGTTFYEVVDICLKGGFDMDADNDDYHRGAL